METATDLRATAAAVARGELSALSFLGLTAKDGEVFAGFAAALLNRGKTSKAAACAQLAVALAPGDGLAWLVLGCARARLGQDAAALAAYETAARLKPESARVWVDLAELALARLDHTTACAALRCALAVDPAGRTPAGARAVDHRPHGSRARGRFGDGAARVVSARDASMSAPIDKQRSAGWTEPRDASVARAGASADIVTRALALNPELAKTTSTEAALAALSQQRALPAQAKAPARPRLLDARPPATPETRDFVARVGASKRDHAAAKLGFAKAAAALDAEARALAIERQAQADAALAAVVDLLRRVDPTLASPKTKVVLEADARFLASIGFRPELAGRKKERDDHGERHQ